MTEWKSKKLEDAHFLLWSERHVAKKTPEAMNALAQAMLAIENADEELGRINA